VCVCLNLETVQKKSRDLFQDPKSYIKMEILFRCVSHFDLEID